MFKPKPLMLLAAIIFVLGATSQVALGDSQVSRPVSVIVAGPGVMTEPEDGADLTESLIGLISSLSDGQPFAFVNANEPSNTLGPVLAGDLEFNALQEEIGASLASPVVRQRRDLLVSALAETYNLLANASAAPGSTVYLMIGDTGQANLDRWYEGLTTMVSLLKDTGWPIVGLSLSGASQETQAFLDKVSIDSGGESFALSVPDGFRGLSNRILRDQQMGSLTEVGIGTLSSGDVLTSTFSVAPGTRDTTLLFFKEGPYGALRLSNPSGFEASSGDRTTSSVMETPRVVIWRLTDPTPGQWSVEVRGIEGVVSAWQHASNKYSPALESLGAVPLNEPSVIIASVRDGREKALLDGVRLMATITTPKGGTLVHELNDDAVSGDSVAGDGFFSATIPPMTIEGEYKVELELSWPEFQHQVTSQSAFTAQAFPAIELTPIQTGGLQPGERAKVATVFVHVQGEPYAIPTEDLTSDLVSNGDKSGVLEITPQRLLDQGRAWLYDVFFTPEEEALNTLIFRLNMAYAGRQYTHTSDFVVLSSIMAAPPPEPAAVPAPPAPPAAPAPVQPPPLPVAQPSGFPWGLLAIPVAIAAILAAAGVYWFTRTRPYGYLYDDRNERVTDFRTLKRHPIMSLLFKSAVRGKELSIPGLEGVWFRFSGKRIALRSQRATPTVRINNQPLIGQTNIQDRTYIGTHGRLFTFLLSPITLQTEPGGAGDD